MYEGEGDEEEREGGEAECSLPADSLEGGHVVLGDELLLQHHLGGHDHLGGEDEEVANKDAGCIILAVIFVNRHRGVAECREGGGGVGGGVAGLLSYHIRGADSDESTNHKQHPHPLEPGQIPPEKYFGEDT